MKPARLFVWCLWGLATLSAQAVEEVHRFDTDNNGISDQWGYYSDDHLVRLEADRNGDGRVDQWITYRAGNTSSRGAPPPIKSNATPTAMAKLTTCQKGR